MLLASFVAPAQEQYHQVGFKVISTYDSSRTYKANTTVSDELHYRPIDIDLWYPAEIASSDTTASFIDLLYLLEQRSSFYDDTRNYDGLTDEMLQYICAASNCNNSDHLKTVKTKSYVNAKRIEQPFPLIIYFSGFNGMSYENHMLFEALATNGFVVASVSSIGRYPGNMTMDVEDLFEQIEDAKFIVRHLTKMNVASPNIGLVGYSWGGLAAAIMSMTEPGIKAVVSLDGSEQFNYVEEEENEKLNRIRQAVFFNPQAIRSSFLYLDSDIAELDNAADSIYNITDHIAGDKSYLKINHSTHEDFSSLSIVSREDPSETKYSKIERLTIDYLLDKIKEEKAFYQTIPSEGITKYFSNPTLMVDSETSGKRTLKGFVTDSKSNRPLRYANIGILNKDAGTISGAKGEFELPLLESNSNDTLRISMVGYEPRVIYLKDALKKQNPRLNISLIEKTNELKEVVITEKKLTKKVLGNKTDSKFFGAKFASGDLGSEIAIKIKIKNTPTYLDTFNFNISYNDEDTATFRVNMYNIKNGLPGKNILTDNILVKIRGQIGKIDIDLSKYTVQINEDFFIGLEWIEGKNISGIVFSAGFLNNRTYYRKASQGRWKKYPMGVGFTVVAKS
jgi:pimeloyl-ACP methyl ester carboxylesterase